MKKSVKKLIKRFVLSIFVIVLIIMLPTVGLKQDSNMELIYRSFIGKKSDYLGFIEIWNIDTFESGAVSKCDILNAVASEYQKENKGTYVLVRNVSETECKNMIAKGQMPDLFSCSYGVASELKDYIEPFSCEFGEVYENLLNAGKLNDSQYGVPWCFGSYYMFSTEQKMEKYFESGQKIDLVKVALETGYDKVYKNKIETIYSLGFGTKEYLLPQKAFESYTGRGIVSDNKAVNKEKVNKFSPYDAYCDFLVGGHNILIGSQRDFIRLKNRESQGKLNGLIAQRVEGFTDLVQFAMPVKNTEQRYKHAQEFVKKLISLKVQSSILKNGMIAVNKSVNMVKNGGIMSNITPEIIGNYKCYNVFIGKTEIRNLQVIS